MVVKNALYLFSVQVANYLLPLFLLPFLSQNLSNDDFVLFAVNQSLLMMWIILLNFGLDLTLTKEVSQFKSRSDSEEKFFLRNTFQRAFVLKLIIFVIGFALFYSVSKFELFASYNKNYIVPVSLCALSFCLYHQWYYQGMQKLKSFSLIHSSLKFMAFPAYFIFIDSETDGYKFFYIYFFTNLLACCYLLKEPVALEVFRVIEKKIFLETLNLFNKTFPVFLSQSSTVLLNQANSLLVVNFLTPKEFVVFSIVERLSKALAGLTSPITNALYPYSARKYIEDKRKLFCLISRISLGATAIYLLTLFAYSSFGEVLIRMIFKDNSSSIFLGTVIMSLVPLSVFLNNLYGTQLGLIAGKNREFLRNILISGGVNVVLIILFAHYYGMYGALVGIVISQLLLLILMLKLAVSIGYRFCL